MRLSTDQQRQSRALKHYTAMAAEAAALPPRRVVKPTLLHLGRERGRPVVAKRIAGHRFEFSDKWSQIYAGDSLRGELGLCDWYRMRDASRWSRPDAWRVCVTLDLPTMERGFGNHAFMDAIVNDFGDLVIVPEQRA